MDQVPGEYAGALRATADDDPIVRGQSRNLECGSPVPLSHVAERRRLPFPLPIVSR